MITRSEAMWGSNSNDEECCMVALFIASPQILDMLRAIRDAVALLPGGSAMVCAYYAVSRVVCGGTGSAQKEETGGS